MLKISKPRIVMAKSTAKLVTNIYVDGERHQIWYKVSQEYAAYLTCERTDAFVVALLWYALKHDHDLIVAGQMSERLYYSLTTHYIPIIAEIHGYRPINIYCEQLTNEVLNNAHAVGTGISCGIDSLCTLYENSQPTTPNGFKITHCVFLNVGSNKDYGMTASEKNSMKWEQKLFKQRAKNSTSCAIAAGKEIILIDSNLSRFLKLPWGKTHTQRSLSAILALQKLFKTYYYASESHLSSFFLSDYDPAYYDVFSFSMLSTETTSFFSSCIQYNRVQRTNIMAKYPLAHNFLNVCYTQAANCGKCAKCLVTLITFELLGQLDKFATIFNLDAYYTKRKSYLNSIIKRRNKNIRLAEIYDLMVKQYLFYCLFAVLNDLK